VWALQDMGGSWKRTARAEVGGAGTERTGRAGACVHWWPACRLRAPAAAEAGSARARLSKLPQACDAQQRAVAGTGAPGLPCVLQGCERMGPAGQERCPNPSCCRAASRRGAGGGKCGFSHPAGMPQGRVEGASGAAAAAPGASGAAARQESGRDASTSGRADVPGTRLQPWPSFSIGPLRPCSNPARRHSLCRSNRVCMRAATVRARGGRYAWFLPCSPRISAAAGRLAMPANGTGSDRPCGKSSHDAADAAPPCSAGAGAPDLAHQPRA
jgi:hypothetical protein